ncbi:MAG: hypothetical protein R3F34_09645 [Planctomycetota bacterium]
MAPLPIAALLALVPASAQDDTPLHGYLQVPLEAAPPEYGGGYSMHVAAWPMLEHHPGPQFQSGLFGTWMFAKPMEPRPEGDVYSDIEGGLGWWRDTRFPTETPKFIMGGVALNFVEWANGPGAGKGRDWDRPAGKYAIAQLSPWIVWPPDGLNLAQGTSGELFGYGYLPLPLTEARATTDGVDVPTGNRCWTLFLDTANFKGPVAFFLPEFFSRPTVERPDLAGRFLDSRPSDSGRQSSMETQHIPAATAEKDGASFARIASTRFPVDASGESVLVHRMTSYTDAALWDGVAAWFAGGPAPTGRIDAANAHVHRVKGAGRFGWSLPIPGGGERDRALLAREDFAEAKALDEATYGFRWKLAGDGSDGVVERTGASLVQVPGTTASTRAEGAVLAPGAGERGAGARRAREGAHGRALRRAAAALRDADGRRVGRARSGRGTVPRGTRRRERRDVQLVPLRRPTGAPRRRTHRRGARGTPAPRRADPPRVDEGEDVPAAADARHAREPRRRARRRAARGPRSRLRADRHAAGGGAVAGEVIAERIAVRHRSTGLD